jgi:hypothetical protein
MRKASTLVGLVSLTSVALAATARAEAPPAAVPAAPPVTSAGPPPAQPAPGPGRTTVVVAFLPMSLGNFTGVPGGMLVTADASFAYGLSVSGRYEIVRGLSVGIAPQAIFNVKPKDQDQLAWPVSKQFDFLARVAYTVPIVETIALYAEVLPGYSIIVPSGGDVPTGFTIAAGAGCAMDLSDRLFVDLGAGYQWGFQKLPAKDKSAETSTKYVRVALGVGWRF